MDTYYPFGAKGLREWKKSCVVVLKLNVRLGRRLDDDWGQNIIIIMWDGLAECWKERCVDVQREREIIINTFVQCM